MQAVNEPIQTSYLICMSRYKQVCIDAYCKLKEFQNGHLTMYRCQTRLSRYKAHFSKNLVSIPKSFVSIPSSISEAQNHVDWFILKENLSSELSHIMQHILNIMHHIKHNLLSYKTKSYKQSIKICKTD